MFWIIMGTFKGSPPKSTLAPSEFKGSVRTKTLGLKFVDMGPVHVEVLGMIKHI